MQYYEPTTTTRYTASQLERRGLLHSSIDLTALEIYLLAEEQPLYDSKLQQLTNERVEEIEDDTENSFRLEWDVEYLPAPTVQAELFARLADRRWKEEIRGIEWEGHFVDTELDSQNKITGEVIAIRENFRDGGKWKMKDGKQPDVSNDQFIEMARAVRAHVEAMYLREGVIKYLIEQASTAEEKVALFETEIDIGWNNSEPTEEAA